MPQQIVQAVHAAHDAGRFYGPPDEAAPAVVVCQTPTESHLLRAYERLKLLKIPCTLFHEPDIDNQATALATAPVETNRNAFAKWKLWKGE
jgi:hypothetical protein